MQQLFSKCIAAAALLASCLGTAAAARGADNSPQVQPAVTAAAGAFARQVIARRDHGRRPFAIVDKLAATIAVYRADGTLVGTSRALLGSARGDESPPGVGARTQAGTLRPSDLTTPAGRFESEPGHNTTGEAVVWVDYDAALAIHRVRHGASRAERLRRLATGDAAASRVSNGCIVVPEAFYDQVVQPLLGRVRGVVYVMPEGRGDSAVGDL